MKEIVYRENTADKATLVSYFETMRENDEIGAVRGIGSYVDKLLSNAVILEAWCGLSLIGICALYCNRVERDMSFIPQIHITRENRSFGVGSKLIRKAISVAEGRGFQLLTLMVNKTNYPAIAFYKKNGFMMSEGSQTQFMCKLKLENKY